MKNNFYPKSPENISKNLTALPSSYQFRASLAVLAIILFFVLYAAMVTAMGYLVYYAFTYEVTYINKFTILLKVGAIAGAIMLFIFTLKFIFKLKNHKPTNRIKLIKDEQSELWTFIDTICKETGAPKPKSIFIDPDVNAYVSYTNMWLSLFLPVKKELTIGLGLVSCLNLSEFKAVVSHEFGHFAQRSMKIGSYIISANTIIHDMIYSRDKWDDILDQWRASDIRLSAAAWVITPMIWGIRQILTLFYQFLNIMYSSLSREMEFNADKVAVSTSGSNAIISALWKLDSGFEKWNNTINHAYLAAQKKLFSKNLYTHNLIAIENATESQKEILKNLPIDTRGGKTFFSDSEISKASMYASHPPNNKREDNAKTPFIECAEDERSPWILFNKTEDIQQEMTTLIHEQYIQKKPTEFSTTDEFENFISQEAHGKDLLEEYQNTFLNRFLTIEKEEELNKKSFNFLNGTNKTLDQLKADLSQLMLPVNELETLMSKAQQISQGTLKENSFSFNGKTYKKKNLQEGYSQLIHAREKLFENDFKEWDVSFCAFHLALAKKESKEKILLKIYKQHDLISQIYRSCVGVKNTIFKELDIIQSREDVTQEGINRFGRKINDLYVSINTNLEEINDKNFVAMPNIDTINELKESIIEGGAFQREDGKIFENGGFDKIINNIENAVVHCQRIDQKSIGLILSFHKELQNNLT